MIASINSSWKGTSTIRTIVKDGVTIYLWCSAIDHDDREDRGLELADSLSQRPWCKATLANATAGRKYTYNSLHSLVLDCCRGRSTAIGRNARNTLRKFLSIASKRSPKREHVEKLTENIEAAFEKNEEEDSQDELSKYLSYLNRLKEVVEEKKEFSLVSNLKLSLESYLNGLEEEDEEECSHDPGWFWLWSCLFWVLFSSLCFSLLITSHALAQLLVAVITHRLLSSGDIERNPGPIYRDAEPTLQELQYMSYTSEDGRTVPFRIMDRIKPRVARLAIALRFPRHIREDLKTESDPVVYLLDEWLRGANQEHDPRPLTWGTLITALQHAGLIEEVKILEEKFVIEPPVDDRRASVTISNNEEQMTYKEISKETDELPKYKTAQKEYLVNLPSFGIVISHNALFLFLLIIMTVTIVLMSVHMHVRHVAVSIAVVPSCPPSHATPLTPPC